ncbi:MAG: hypothetical protein DWI03_03225 [Planctomycetota bacterium]|nr:MAG: hypothetical protein DWI03_03225 [Planctomycetota bacterium]
MKLPALKFDKESLLDWLLRHGEKVAVSIVALGALALAWGGVAAVRSKSVPAGSTPQAITKLANEANQNIQRAKPPATPRQEGQLAQAIDPWRPERVKITAWSKGAPFDRPLFQQLAKRSAPAVFGIEDLHASAGIAVFAPDAVEKPASAVGAVPEPTPDPAAAPRPGRPRPGVGQRPLADAQSPPGGVGAAGPAGEPAKPPPGRIVPYILVTGKIPVAKQKAEFARCFAGASGHDPKRDLPKWDAWRIERTLVVPGGSERWEKVAVKNVAVGGRAPDQGAGPAPVETREESPPEFLLGKSDSDVSYAQPLPMRIDEAWGAAGLHPWFVPKWQKLREEQALGGRESAGGPIDVELQDLADSPAEYASQTVTVKNVVVHGGAVRQQDVRLYRIGVATKGGKEFPGAAIGNDKSLTFAVSENFGPRLEEVLPANEQRSCDLTVRLDMMGKTPVARILTVAFLDEAGTIQEEAAETDTAVVSIAADGSIQTGGPTATPTRPAPSSLEYRLFRFVDTNVKPGQRYRYRVRLSVRNPNFDLDVEHMVDMAATKDPLLISKESNSTEAVLVPDPTAVLVRLLTKTDGGPKKPRFEILVLASDRASGNYSIRSLITDVGGVANIDKRLMNKPGDYRARGDDITTDRIVVDMRGQQEERSDAKPGVKPASKPPEPQEPPEVLLLHADGSFEFTSAAESAPRVERYIGTLPPAEDRKSTGRSPVGPAVGQPADADPFGTKPSQPR